MASMHLVDGVPGGQFGAGLERGQVVGPAGQAVPGVCGVPGRPVALPGGEAFPPGRVQLGPACDLLAVELAHLVGHPERLVGREPEDLLGHPDLLGTEGVPVRVRRVGQLRRRPADVAAQHEQVRLGVGAVGGCLERLADGSLQPVDVVRHLAQVAHAPAVGLEALGHVVVVGQLGRAVDRDVVVVVEGEQAPQPEVAGQRRRLVGDPLHEAAVAGDDEGPVVADVATERGPQPAFGERHADRVGQALAERAGRDLDAGGVAGLGVARRPAAPLAELAQVVQGQVVAGEVQHGVLQDGGVPVGEDEAVAVGPLRVTWVVGHDPGPEHVGQGGERHGGARVPRLGGFRRVHGEASDDVDAELDQPGVLDDGWGGVQRHGQP